MATTDIPDRYGRARTRPGAGRRVKIVGAVLGAALLAFIAWAGGSYLSRTPISGQLLSYTVESATRVRAQVEVSKAADATAACTVRSRDTDGAEVGRRTVRVTQHSSDVRTWITLRTTGRATNAELISCGKG